MRPDKFTLGRFGQDNEIADTVDSAISQLTGDYISVGKLDRKTGVANIWGGMHLTVGHDGNDWVCTVWLGQRVLGGITRIENDFSERLALLVESCVSKLLFEVFDPLMTNGFDWEGDHQGTGMRWTNDRQVVRFGGGCVDNACHSGSLGPPPAFHDLQQSIRRGELTLSCHPCGRRWMLILHLDHQKAAREFSIDVCRLPPSPNWARVVVEHLMSQCIEGGPDV